MNEAEYFQRALQDADFRREKILEQREHRKLTRNLAIGFGVILVACCVATGVAEGHWLGGVSGMIGSVMVMAWSYSTATTRLRALEAMDGKDTAGTPVAAR